MSGFSHNIQLLPIRRNRVHHVACCGRDFFGNYVTIVFIHGIESKPLSHEAVAMDVGRHGQVVKAAESIPGGLISRKRNPVVIVFDSCIGWNASEHILDMLRKGRVVTEITDGLYVNKQGLIARRPSTHHDKASIPASRTILTAYADGMAFSQARDFSVTESSFNEVHRDYNHQETTFNPQSISLGYSSESSSPPPAYHHIYASASPDPTHTSVAASPVASYGSNIGGNQTNHVHNYYTLAGSYSSYHLSSPPVPSSVHATAPAQLPGQVPISVILDNEVKRRGRELNWRQSIVDILKLLNLDSMPEARKRLAKAVGYDGDTAQVSSKMNIWLRRYVQNVIESVGGDLTAARRILLQKM